MRIQEIFQSLQGEGRDQGRPCTFVRCAGCNLDCAWCDTRYARQGGTEMNTEDLMYRIRSGGIRYVCLTGGEPLLQASEVGELLDALYPEGFRVELQTNGTLDFTPFQPRATINMDVKCPSSGERSDLSLLARIRKEDSVTFVVAGPADCEYAETVLDEHPVRGEVFLSPVWGSAYGPVVRYVLEHRLPVRFQLQLHRILGMR